MESRMAFHISQDGFQSGVRGDTDRTDCDTIPNRTEHDRAAAMALGTGPMGPGPWAWAMVEFPEIAFTLY